MSARDKLDEWLALHGAREIWRGSRTGSAKNAPTPVLYSFRGGATAFVLVYADGGWSIYTELPENNIDRSLADAELRMGLSSRAGSGVPQVGA